MYKLLLLIAILLSGCNQPTLQPTIVTPVTPLIDWVKSLMVECGVKLSDLHSATLAEQVAGTAEVVFSDRNQQEAFALLVAIESRYNPKARSTAGAVGLTQVMPKFAQGFADACGLGKLEQADLEHAAVNLKVGACQFKRLLDAYEGSIPKALASYNSGQNSPTVKRLSAGAEGHPETSGYLAKFVMIQDRMKQKEMKK